MKNLHVSLAVCAAITSLALANQVMAQPEPGKQTPQSTEIWEPVPP